MSFSNVRYFYTREPGAGDVYERIVTVAYKYNKQTGEVFYGATMFRKESNRECFNKKMHRITATGRLNKRPVNIVLSAENYPELERKIRESIRTHGVCGDRV